MILRQERSKESLPRMDENRFDQTPSTTSELTSLQKDPRFRETIWEKGANARSRVILRASVKNVGKRASKSSETASACENLKQT